MALIPYVGNNSCCAACFEPDASSVEPQLDELKASGADVLMDFAEGRVATEAIRHVYDSGWRPLQFIPTGSLSIAAFLQPAGLNRAAAIVSSARSRGWLRGRAASDPEAAEYVEWMRRYNPHADLRDTLKVWAYEVSQMLVEVLRRCGDNLTRADVLKQAANLDMAVKMLRPAIRVTTSPTDYESVKRLYLLQFDGREGIALN